MLRLIMLTAVARPRDVAQLGSAFRSGRKGRGFESRHPDLIECSEYLQFLELRSLQRSGSLSACIFRKRRQSKAEDAFALCLEFLPPHITISRWL